ncbi:MAG: hypothetical protein LBR58_00175 [Propionibacteriaceae bacterium]|jgi:hypothetical protein|nr:hypothetical protein [Propionibacteriaceae bacterium]
MSFDCFVYARGPLAQVDWPAVALGAGVAAVPGAAWVELVDMASGEVICSVSGPEPVDVGELPSGLEEVSGIKVVYEFSCPFEAEQVERTLEAAQGLAERLNGWRWDSTSGEAYGPDGARLDGSDSKEDSARQFIDALPHRWQLAQRVAAAVVCLACVALAAAVAVGLYLEMQVSDVHGLAYPHVWALALGCLVAGVVAEFLRAWLADRRDEQVRRSLPAWHTTNPKWRSAPHEYRRYGQAQSRLLQRVALAALFPVMAGPVMAFSALMVKGLPPWLAPLSLAVAALFAAIAWLARRQLQRRVERQVRFEEDVFG